MACFNSQTLFLPRGEVAAFGEPKLSTRLNFALPTLSKKASAASVISCSAPGQDMAAAAGSLGSEALTREWSSLTRRLNLDRTEKETSNHTSGKFGRFGGKFVPETLITSLNMLEAEFNLVLNDDDFQVRPGFFLVFMYMLIFWFIARKVSWFLQVFF